MDRRVVSDNPIENARAPLLLTGHWTMGKYDIVVTFDAPSDAALSAFTLGNASLGNVRTETFRAYTRDEFAGILKAI